MTIPSLMQQSFTDAYDEFLFACSHGDYLSVERLLHDGTISRTDISTIVGDEKLSPIGIAIEHNHLEVIKILLDYLPYGDFREALLLAIYLDLTKIAQLIMGHATFNCFYGTFADWQRDTVVTFDESHFGSIQPIQLAAQFNRTTILYNFLKRAPHNIECKCNECILAGLNDSLRHSQLRLSTYRGLSSDVYLALVSHDPITSAFDISAHLSELIKNETNYRTEYLALFNQVSHFTARLLDHIQNQTELESLLTVERLNSAIQHNQQEFITHANTQQRLTDIWYHNIDLARSDRFKKRFSVMLYYFLIFIPMYIGYFWFPFYFEHQCQWYFQQPAIQELIHATTYQIFLIVLIFSSIFTSPGISLKIEYPPVIDHQNRSLSMDEKRICYEKNLVSFLKIIILIWMVGYVYRNVSKMIRQRRCLDVFGLFTTILFILYIFLYPIAVIQVHQDWQNVTDIDGWNNLGKLLNTSQNEYVKMIEQFESDFLGRSHNSELAADGIFALILVCCIIHLCIFLLDSEYVGPLLVSLIKMSRTIYRWFIFILIFIVAYGVSFLHLFSYYSDEKSYGDKTHYYLNTTISVITRANISQTFGNLTALTKDVFFCLFSIDKNELTGTYLNEKAKNYTTNDIHYERLNLFTSLIGSLIYGTLALGIRIILITMIIAYIKRRYDLNKQQVLNDWKFARAKLHMSFIYKDPDILPVPLNLILTPRHIRKFFSQKSKSPMKKLIRKNGSQKNKYLRNLNYSSYDYNPYKKTTSDDIMNCIVLRFLKKYHPSDVQSLKRARQVQYKEELSEIRRYILDEVEMLQQANHTLNKHISTVFFGLK